MTQLKGLTADVFRTPNYNGGDILTNRVDEVTVINIGAPVGEADPQRPPVKVCTQPSGYKYARPLNQPEGRGMAGGNFIYTSDSRLREVCAYPISVHDRLEAQKGDGVSTYEDMTSGAILTLCVLHGARVPSLIWQDYLRPAQNEPKPVCEECTTSSEAHSALIPVGNEEANNNGTR